MDGRPAVTALLQVPEWHERALCRQTDPDLFFPEKGSGLSSLRQARRICARCEVRTECREDAIARDERFGVWGGTSEAERRGMRRARREASC
ncbi:WhiB family transcriptional regulator [Micromonospora sp. CB01531]|uniref:WhiB family transcriptional regulator n=1 Tax=Micromonospora sp. CB01531 TaxID=1718947 RepID=UPI00093D178A|nr:WhiB family transcriptional regulator [Micromonospora sp. CB01531]OKI47269.1 transcription factor WhiB [Micromonospora sp. CB01531]